MDRGSSKISSGRESNDAQEDQIGKTVIIKPVLVRGCRGIPSVLSVCFLL